MSNITIVPCTTDAEKDGRGYVHWKSWQETYTGLMPAEYLAKQTLEKCVAIAHRWPERTLIAKDGERVVGFACYGVCDDESLSGAGEVYALYVLQEYHGRKVGYALMNAAVELLRDHERIALWVLKGNERAIRFYERYGFRFDGTEKVEAVGTELRMVYTRED